MCRREPDRNQFSRREPDRLELAQREASTLQLSCSEVCRLGLERQVRVYAALLPYGRAPLLAELNVEPTLKLTRNCVRKINK
jgi:hypothetical protein